MARAQAYADYHDLMAMTEEMVAQMVLQLRGSYRMEYHANGADTPPVQIDFTPPWRRISMARPALRPGRQGGPADVAQIHCLDVATDQQTRPELLQAALDTAACAGSFACRCTSS